MGSVDHEYTVLRMAYRGATLEQAKRILTQGPQGLDDRRANALIGAMKAEGLIDVVNITTPEFENCVESVSSDKRVKNPQEYCLKRYPLKIVLKITEYGLVRLIERALELYPRLMSPLGACIELAREFRNRIGSGLFVYNMEAKRCMLATQLYDGELYSAVKDHTKWSGLPLVIVHGPRPGRYKPV